MKVINGKKYLTIAEASIRLGVSSNTLRVWDREGKFKPDLLTSKGYRLYLVDTINNAVNDNMELNTSTIGYCISSLDIEYTKEEQEKLLNKYFKEHKLEGVILSDSDTAITIEELKNLKVLIHMITNSNKLMNIIVVSRYIFTARIWITLNILSKMFNIKIIEIERCL